MSPILKQQAVGARVRQLRADSGLSLRALAANTGFSPSFISQVENGQASPSISSMQKIAEALGVTLGEFFAAAATAAPALVVRHVDRPLLQSSWSQGQVEALAPMGAGRRLEPVLITLDPGGRSGKHPQRHAMEEFAYVLEGELTLMLGPEAHALSAGDAVTLRPDELRRWENCGTKPARVLVVSARIEPNRAVSVAPLRRAPASPRRRRPSNSSRRNRRG